MNKDIRRRMSDKHERWLADQFGVEPSPGSGNQFHRPMDGRTRRLGGRFGFAWDGKSTLGKSVGVTLAMLDKAIEQARFERPMIALRWYDGEDLRSFRDWFLVRAEDFMETWGAVEPTHVCSTCSLEVRFALAPERVEERPPCPQKGCAGHLRGARD